MNECCMKCRNEAVFVDTKTNEFLCERCGRINAQIYNDRNEPIQMQRIEFSNSN